VFRRLGRKINSVLERYFPERRIFLRSDMDTRYIRVGPFSQLTAFTGGTIIIAWSIIATAIILMDSIGSGNFREQAKRDQRTYEMRLNALSSERDKRAEEAIAAQERFTSALSEISSMQSELLASETRRNELETGIEIIQATLQRMIRERDEAVNKMETLTASADAASKSAVSEDISKTTMAFVTDVLKDTAEQRDEIHANAQDAITRANQMERQIKVMEQENDQIFRHLEEAMTISVEPLDKMCRAAGMNTDDMINTVRRGYAGLGGPGLPLSFPTGGEEPTEDAIRATKILNRLDRLNLYRIAAEKAPFAMPLKGSYRFTSGFGMRWGRMHSGSDFAGPHGSPIYATAEGVVTKAGWQSAYGRLIKIQHAFGIETRYAHLSRIRVKEGERVSRGQRIGDMGNTGRSTGTHLHYEVRVNGRAINPMIYIKAARNVF